MKTPSNIPIKQITAALAVIFVPGSLIAVIGYFIWKLIHGYTKRTSTSDS